MTSLYAGLTAFFGMLLVMLLVSFLMAYPTMLLWNGCLVDAIPGIKTIGWLQAWGITILTGLLFKSSVKTA